MPWELVKFNDGKHATPSCGSHALTRSTTSGNAIPSLGFGTWKIPKGQTTTDQVDQAISVGFSHIGQLVHWVGPFRI